MAVITLTTDLGTKDYYLSTIKGAIISQYPEAQIVDISHEINKHDILQAAFTLRNAYRSFPNGTIHILGLNPESSIDSRHVAIFIDGHYFVGSDNGIFSLIFDKKPDMIVELNLTQETDFLTFPTNDVFVKAACHIARGGTLEVIGKEIENYHEKTMIRPIIDNNVLKGSVIYIDSYGNVITNITTSLFKEAGHDREFTIYLKQTGYTISQISATYNEVPDGEKLALFSSTGYLEIAINQGGASGLMGLDLNDTIRIEFKG